MQQAKFNQSLLEFLGEATTPWHAVEAMTARLRKAGFKALKETDDWKLESNQAYYVVRNGSALIAFRTGASALPDKQGIRMIGAHTDSPCLKVKPNPELRRKDYLQLGVEVYGGVLMNPWFDRDLSLAGRVTYRDAAGAVHDTLIDFRKPLAYIPSLAIHLDREANTGRTVNAQQHLPPVLLEGEEANDLLLSQLLLEQIKAEPPKAKPESILAYELCFYDTQPPALVGLREQFIASARLDNLLSCFIGMQALLHSAPDQPALLVCNDHEEVGSMSAEGAQGPFLQAVLDRWCGPAKARTLARSMMISADNAHGIHPNYIDRHDENHGPILNKGPVIKVNHNQRYATNSRSAAVYRHISDELGLPHQTFVVRSDMGCGSTIGPLTAAALGVLTLDIGVPQWAMHSIREIAGSSDGFTLFKVLTRFYETEALPGF